MSDVPQRRATDDASVAEPSTASDPSAEADRDEPVAAPTGAEASPGEPVTADDAPAGEGSTASSDRDDSVPDPDEGSGATEASEAARVAPIAAAVSLGNIGPGRGASAANGSGGDGGGPGSRVCEVELEEFEGPLDLLLHLVRRHELDILDIPISFVCEKYLEYIEFMRTLELEVAGDYLVMAATLAYLKSRELVPRQEEELEAGVEEEGPDPREQLIARLLEYQKFRDAARQLDARPMSGRDTFARGQPIELPPVDAGLAPITLFRLAEAYQRVLERARIHKSHEVVMETISVADRMQQLTGLLITRSRLDFEKLFLDKTWTSEGELRSMLVVTLMSVLELVRMGVASVHQPIGVESIVIERVATEEEARKALASYDEAVSFGKGAADKGGADRDDEEDEAGLELESEFIAESEGDGAEPVAGDDAAAESVATDEVVAAEAMESELGEELSAEFEGSAETLAESDSTEQVVAEPQPMDEFLAEPEPEPEGHAAESVESGEAALEIDESGDALAEPDESGEALAEPELRDEADAELDATDGVAAEAEPNRDAAEPRSEAPSGEPGDDHSEGDGATSVDEPETAVDPDVEWMADFISSMRPRSPAPGPEVEDEPSPASQSPSEDPVPSDGSAEANVAGGDVSPRDGAADPQSASDSSVASETAEDPAVPGSPDGDETDTADAGVTARSVVIDSPLSDAVDDGDDVPLSRQGDNDAAQGSTEGDGEEHRENGETEAGESS